MSAMNDPIDDFTPVAKRRKLNPEYAWNSDNSSDNFNEDDFQNATIATIPLSKAKQPTPFTTQPTQPVPKSPEIQVGRSSPVNLPSPKHAEPIKRRTFPKSGILASAIAPPGTAFRLPPGARAKPVVVDLDSDDDPPVQHSDDEETQGIHSNLKPTNFQKGGRGSNSSPNTVTESPNFAQFRFDNKPPSAFMSLLSEVSSKPSPSKTADDMASAYGSASRGSRPRPNITSTKTQTKPDSTMYHDLEDITDERTKRLVKEIRLILGNTVSIQQCADAVTLKKWHKDDAVDYLLAAQNISEDDPLDAATSPPKRKGIAQSVSTISNTKQVKPFAKQEVKAPVRTIAEKYGSTQRIAKDEEEVKPKRRLVQGRKAASRDTPPSSPAKPASPAKSVIQIESDSEAESEPVVEIEDEEQGGEAKLLKFLNECSAGDLAELCNQPAEVADHVLEQRPFSNLDQVRNISMAVTTKSGKKSRARAIGAKLVDDGLEMLTGYDAVDDLVKQCERIAAPLKRALDSWGVGDGNNRNSGELHIMKLDEAHDSGIGTPIGSHSPDDATSKRKGRFISQPHNMSTDITLKDYQLVGVNWLNLLYEKRLSCILADDMGLGKTCQIIAFLSYLQLKEVDGVHLIIVPGSTLENWLREFERFSPDLNVRPYYGAQKERELLRYELEESFHELDVIVTTYEMAASKEDNKFLRRCGPYSVCVYDEAHALRNPKSNRYQQLVRIGADFKVLLTGTPLQNNLQELIAILAFIMPDLFQHRREDLEVIFKHKATTKDATHAAMLSAERVARARSMMTPFILRRKKEQVLDLPTKHRRVEYCDMTKSQSMFYAEIRGEAFRIQQEKQAGSNVTSAASANIIMALRKIAIHPLLSRRLYDAKKIDKIVAALSKSDEFGGNSVDKIRAYITGEAGISLGGGDFALHHFCSQRDALQKYALKHQEWMDSGKVKLFQKLIKRFSDNGDRTLVFSQFTTVMDILESVLETLGIKFMRLDGSTRMDIRQDMIDQFTTDDSIPVFMLSTKAGGAGINLAVANKVIIFDSGFNPQDDIQAENRAHRVGQTREVEVIRMVTRGTIEDQIHALGESKLALDEKVAGEAATEKAGEQLVQQMFMEELKKDTEPGDVKDIFKKGLEDKGLKIVSKQAQF